jgi:hypothetical protein
MPSDPAERDDADGAGSPQDLPPQDLPAQDLPAQDLPAQGLPPQDLSPQGLSWSWEMDFDALLAALTGTPPPETTPAGGPSGAGAQAGGVVSPEDEEAAQDAILEELAALDAEGAEGGQRVPMAALAGRVAERLAPGPDLAAWLASAPVAGLDDGDLAAVAGSWRRVASWAQARELAAVAQIAARAAARDEKIGTGPDGRPARIPVSAAAEVALELTMSQYGASAWSDLAVELEWRLAATGAALAAGVIDVPRARLIAEATGMLTDQNARAVENMVLPAAGEQTTGMLRATLRRAVISVDPRGAEERRKQAERQAKVVLYPDEHNTATLAGQRLPAVLAAAAMARLNAIARAMKASGAGGGMDLLRAQALLGKILGTLPLIPPAEGAPPDAPPDCPGEGPDDDPGDDPHDDHGGPGEGLDGENLDSENLGDGQAGNTGGGPARASRPDDPPADDSLDEDVPPPGDQDAPRDDEDYPCPDDSPAGGYLNDDDDWPGRGPARDWPDLPAVIPPAFAGPGSRPADGRPPAGLLDISLPWQVLAGISPAPGYLGRIGPITATQARRLAHAASGDPGTEWRIIVTTTTGQALAVTRIPRPRHRGRDGPPGSGTGKQPGTGRPDAGMKPGAGIGLVGRVTLTIPEDILSHPPPGPGPGEDPGPSDRDPPGGILALALQAARRAAGHARAAIAADAAAGGCAHTAASPAYRPPPRLKEYIAARDLTCRFLRCRQPAWRGDLDHTIPFDDGGRTCSCNLGGVCRTHHLLKHQADWNLRQVAPGVFTWTTPAGRTYTSTPDTHPL